MHSTTDPKGIQTPTSTTTAGGEDLQGARRRHRVELVLWIIGFIIFVISCVMVHAHPKPFSIDLATTQAVQGLQIWPWLRDVLVFISTFNNPIPSLSALGLLFVGMLLIALIRHRRGKSALAWVQAAIGLVLAVAITTGLQGIAEVLVARPRPDPHAYPIHVYTPLVPFPTFPSGHTSHDTVYYGFLLYLSVTRPVREWRYHWLLLPFQILAALDILSIGYSRILEGDHWLTDVLAGYLEGALYLLLFIWIYRWATNALAKWQAKRQFARK